MRAQEIDETTKIMFDFIFHIKSITVNLEWEETFSLENLSLRVYIYCIFYRSIYVLSGDEWWQGPCLQPKTNFTKCLYIRIQNLDIIEMRQLFRFGKELSTLWKIVLRGTLFFMRNCSEEENYNADIYSTDH